MTHLERAKKELKRATYNLDAVGQKASEKQVRDLREKVEFWDFVVDVLGDYYEE